MILVDPDGMEIDEAAEKKDSPNLDLLNHDTSFNPQNDNQRNQLSSSQTGISSTNEIDPPGDPKTPNKDDPKPKNPAKDVLKAGMAAAAVASVDPIPGDEVAIAIGALAAAGLVWVTVEVTEKVVEFAKEHTKGARKSTQAKHQAGQARKAQDRNGSKGEQLPPRRRPGGWRGS